MARPLIFTGRLSLGALILKVITPCAKTGSGHARLLPGIATASATAIIRVRNVKTFNYCELLLVTFEVVCHVPLGQ